MLSGFPGNPIILLISLNVARLCTLKDDSGPRGRVAAADKVGP